MFVTPRCLSLAVANLLLVQCLVVIVVVVVVVVVVIVLVVVVVIVVVVVVVVIVVVVILRVYLCIYRMDTRCLHSRGLASIRW